MALSFPRAFRASRLLAASALFGLGMTLAGCGNSRVLTPDPYFTYVPRQAGRPVPPITRPMVAVCTDDRADTEARVQAMVASVCADPLLVRKDITGDCTLRLPIRVTYFCSKIDAKKLVIHSPVRSFATLPKFQAGSNEGAENPAAPEPSSIEPPLPTPGPDMFPPAFRP